MNKILYIGNKLEKYGNSPTSADILPKFLNSEKFEVKVCSEQKNKLLRLLDFTYHVFFYGSQSKYVLIDTYSTLNFWYAIWCGFLCRLIKVRYIPLLRGGNLDNRLIKNKKIATFYFENSHINIAPSEFMVRTFRERDIRNIKHIPNTIILSNYDFQERSRIKPSILWVRAFDKVYNPEMAITVLEILRKDYPDAKLCMVGPDKDGSHEELKKMAKDKDLAVKFPGKLKKTEWIELSKDYDIFINTTSIDNTPVSVIEAMALGMPVVSTNVGGIPYLINNTENGLLVDSNDAKAMAMAVEQLIENPELTEKLSVQGRQKVENFNWAKVKPLWLELLG
ncbi:glycosyltransferase family 4 protein [Christiangramia echinicola]|uniref:Glycosyltransferase involved in cell wall bisynthesis n=1 Tax=Christiangramia echinicola TaxID=279359 RepID=A0A1H1L2M5_9FLAO|nr:glycosyltransferase family 4 protein [Christiangramia echinicola]SDR68763.1 Glycosyltransferase involved in cell wall bisynthesis [Christiangramia echinicola]